jgi:hypothetical protein
MHGIIFSELKKYVDERLGAAAWGALLEKAGMSGRIFMPVQEYPDADAVKLVCAVAKGIARGMARHFKETVATSESSCMLAGAKECRISVQRQPPPR